MATQVWQCSPAGALSNAPGTTGGPVAPNTPLPIVVSQTNPPASSTGVCQLASQTPSSWYTRATTDGINYSWVTLASLGIGMVTTPPNVGTLTVAWKAPTANTDNTTPVTPLSSYAIWQGSSATSLGAVPVATVPATQLSYTTPPLPAGTYFFSVEAIAADGSDSALSPAVSAVLTGPLVPEVPGAPTSVTITATITATV